MLLHTCTRYVSVRLWYSAALTSLKILRMWKYFYKNFLIYFGMQCRIKTFSMYCKWRYNLSPASFVQGPYSLSVPAQITRLWALSKRQNREKAEPRGKLAHPWARSERKSRAMIATSTATNRSNMTFKFRFLRRRRSSFRAWTYPRRSR